jgi:hypothetical protein
MIFKLNQSADVEAVGGLQEPDKLIDCGAEFLGKVFCTSP